MTEVCGCGTRMCPRERSGYTLAAKGRSALAIFIGQFKSLFVAVQVQVALDLHQDVFLDGGGQQTIPFQVAVVVADDAAGRVCVRQSRRDGRE